ncbi:Lipid A 3-O-deacylase (PagL) [Pseudoduganella namucuonensis]|uniref:Lipid A deacylase n=2 Tax=Pseudoduganella namucuonensis TaxID=1035707 RepID=A0A1I7L948_9BURK|nr:Lipid A 3-O-deacylase (PagL) [Pseudoduganella namucuonensis]
MAPTQKEPMYIKHIIAASAALLAVQASHAADRMFDTVYGEFASGSKIRMARAGATADWNKQWFQSNGTSLSGYWDASVGAWRGTQARNIPGAHQNIVDIGFTPVFRFQSDSKKGFYAEAGIGLHLLSKTYNNNDDRLSTAFQFGDHIGVGYVFNNNWEVALKMQHYSNGGIKKPNSGVDYGVVKVAYRF